MSKVFDNNNLSSLFIVIVDPFFKQNGDNFKQW